MRSVEKSPSPLRRKILLVDDHPFMRMGLAQLINQQSDLVVGGEAGDPAEAARALDRNLPDLVLTDITMPGRSGLEFIKDLKATRPNLRILVVSMHDEAIYAARVLRSGAQAPIQQRGGLCQGPFWRTATRAGVSRPLHPSRRRLQSPSASPARRPSLLRLERIGRAHV